MIGPLPVKLSNAHIPNLSDVNTIYWAYNFEKLELEATGYVCTRCGNSQIIKRLLLDEETGMVACD